MGICLNLASASSLQPSSINPQHPTDTVRPDPNLTPTSYASKMFVFPSATVPFPHYQLASFGSFRCAAKELSARASCFKTVLHFPTWFPFSRHRLSQKSFKESFRENWITKSVVCTGMVLRFVNKKLRKKTTCWIGDCENTKFSMIFQYSYIFRNSLTIRSIFRREQHSSVHHHRTVWMKKMRDRI